MAYIGKTNLNDYAEKSLGSLGIDVSIKIPKQVNEFLKQIPSIRQEFKQAGTETETQASRALATGESIVRTVQVVGVVLAFGAIIAALLVREKK